MKKTLFAILLFTLNSWARPEISISKEVEISQREVLRLSDIAEVHNGSEELLSLMSEVVLRDDARGLLLKQDFPAQEILLKMRQALENKPELKAQNPAFKIASSIKVNFSTTPISKSEVERKIRNTLQARCHECEYHISIQSTPVPGNKIWDLDMSQLSGKGGFLLPVKDGDTRQLKWISGTIRTSQLTPVTTRLILQGERVQAEDLTMSMTDVTFAKDGVLRMQDITGQLAARSLAVSSPIWARDLRREPAAKRGQIVKVTTGDENFEISINATAEENGFIGDLIKIKSSDNQKMLSGIVTEKGVVKLQ